MSFRFNRGLLTAVVFFMALLQQAVGASDIATVDEFAVFSKRADKTAYRLDHSPWNDFLRSAVYDLGPSDRRPAPRAAAGGATGMRLSTASRSRYRFEGNRVLFRLFDEGAVAFARAYRSGLVGIFDQIDYALLDADEQLAFWLNLHNAILIEEIARVHPVARPQAITINRDEKAHLFEAKLVTVAGVPLSLNDIRHKIVYPNWPNPYVVYGFWDGTIGGPSIQPTAYDGENVEILLRKNARNYVNSLRGVSSRSGKLRVSAIYDKAKALFPNWPEDVITHLAENAQADVAALLPVHQGASLGTIPYDAATADLTGGETAKFSGSDNPAAFAGSTVLDRYGRNALSSEALRYGLPPGAIRMIAHVEERRRERSGTVTITDVETDDRQHSAEDSPTEPNGRED